jgi:hypothetical protein
MRSRTFHSLDALLIGIVATVIGAWLFEILPASIRLSGAAVAVIVCLSILAIRLLVALLTLRQSSLLELSRASYGELANSLPVQIVELVEKADTIQIVGGTMIEFVRQAATVEALAIAASRGVKLQMIMLDPEAPILQAVATERASRAGTTIEEELERLQIECKYSIDRLRAALSKETVDRTLRLSSVMPHHAFQRYDENYILTPYTFGRGGSAASAYLQTSNASKQLCAGLAKGFEELWHSDCTVSLTTSEVRAG